MHHGIQLSVVPRVMPLATSPLLSPKSCDTRGVCGPTAKPALPSAPLQNVESAGRWSKDTWIWCQAILEHLAQWCLSAIHPLYFSPVTTSQIFFKADMTKTKRVSTFRITDCYEHFIVVPRKHPGLKTVSENMKCQP